MNSCSAETQHRSPVPNRSKRLALNTHSRLSRLRKFAVAELGAEMFEFAIVAPILLMLLIGIFWVGRAFNVYETITRAAREGVRYAVLPSSVAAGNAEADTPSSSCATNTNAYNNYIVPALTADNLDPNNVKNYCQKSDWLENTQPKQCGISISFEYQVQMTIPFTSINATTINIPANAQMRLENQPTGATCP